jgi:hypothetical protein
MLAFISLPVKQLAAEVGRESPKVAKYTEPSWLLDTKHASSIA